MSLPVFHPSHWPISWSEPNREELELFRYGFLLGDVATDFIFQRLMSEDSVVIPTWSDSELVVWAYRYLKELPDIQQEWLWKLGLLSGMSESDWDYFSQDFGDCFCNTDFFLTQFDWPVAESLVMHTLTACGINWRGRYLKHSSGFKYKVDQHIVFHLPKEGRLWSILRGRRILIISGYASLVVDRLSDPEWLALQGVEKDFHVVGGIQSPSMQQMPKAEYWNYILDLLHVVDFDLALLACGTLCIPLCNVIRRLGKKAIDIGKLDNVIAGHSRERVEGLVVVPSNQVVTMHGAEVDSRTTMWVNNARDQLKHL